MKKRLPPYGKQYIDERPALGPWVYFGAQAWRRAEALELVDAVNYPAMVLPPERQPEEYKWPVRRQDVLALETGPPDDMRLRRLVQVLLESGAASVVVRRNLVPPEYEGFTHDEPEGRRLPND